MQNLVEIDSAVMNMRMREKSLFVWIFVNISRSIYPVFRRDYRSHFWDDFNALWLKRRVFQPLVPFGGLDNTF